MDDDPDQYRRLLRHRPVRRLTGPDGRLLVGTLGRQFVMVGLCGGYTTFSAYSLETFDLLRGGRALAAGANLVLSLAFCLTAAWLGHRIARRLNR